MLSIIQPLLSLSIFLCCTHTRDGSLGIFSDLASIAGEQQVTLRDKEWLTKYSAFLKKEDNKLWIKTPKLLYSMKESPELADLLADFFLRYQSPPHPECFHFLCDRLVSTDLRWSDHAEKSLYNYFRTKKIGDWVGPQRLRIKDAGPFEDDWDVFDRRDLFDRTLVRSRHACWREFLSQTTSSLHFDLGGCVLEPAETKVNTTTFFFTDTLIENPDCLQSARTLQTKLAGTEKEEDILFEFSQFLSFGQNTTPCSWKNLLFFWDEREIYKLLRVIQVILVHESNLDPELAFYLTDNILNLNSHASRRADAMLRVLEKNFDTRKKMSLADFDAQESLISIDDWPITNRDLIRTLHSRWRRWVIREFNH